MAESITKQQCETAFANQHVIHSTADWGKTARDNAITILFNDNIYDVRRDLLTVGRVTMQICLIIMGNR
jgi:hypothetical protein